MRTARTLALTLLAVALLVHARGELRLAQVGTFSSPTYVTAPPQDPRRFVVEQGGTVQILRPDLTRPAAPFLDISARITTGGERGLLSIAFSPDYASNGLFYASFTNGAGDIEVDEFGRSASDPDRADPAPRRTLFTIAHPQFANHNGGNLQFGPDGLLYAGTGDGGSGGDPNGNGQNANTMLGKLLRNAPRNAGERPVVVAIGLRNPWRFSFDRRTHDLVIGDVGQDRVEEIDFLAAGGLSDRPNFGWNRFEGNEDFSTHTPLAPQPGFVFPVITHTHADGWCSITGGYVLRDGTITADLQGKYVYGDFCKGDIYAATMPGAGDDAPTGLHVASLSSFGEDACGRVYALSLDGPVYALVSAGEGKGTCILPKGQAPACACPPPDTGTGTAADRTAPALRLTATRRQRRGRTIRFTLRCDERCTITASGRTLDRRAGRLAGHVLGAGASVPLRLTLGTAIRGALARSLRRHRSVVLTLGVRATDAAGNAATRRLRLRVTR